MYILKISPTKLYIDIVLLDYCNITNFRFSHAFEHQSLFLWLLICWSCAFYSIYLHVLLNHGSLLSGFVAVLLVGHNVLYGSSSSIQNKAVARDYLFVSWCALCFSGSFNCFVFAKQEKIASEGNVHIHHTCLLFDKSIWNILLSIYQWYRNGT